jgi:hypothetical protein
MMRLHSFTFAPSALCFPAALRILEQPGLTAKIPGEHLIEKQTNV